MDDILDIVRKSLVANRSVLPGDHDSRIETSAPDATEPMMVYDAEGDGQEYDEVWQDETEEFDDTGDGRGIEGDLEMDDE